jgi:hypothetical protein
METVDFAWREVVVLRARLEGARDLAVRLEQQPWEGAETWLTLTAIEIALTLTRLEQLADALGAVPAAAFIDELRQLVTEGWSRPAEACAAALARLPALEAVLPIPPAE